MSSFLHALIAIAYLAAGGGLAVYLGVVAGTAPAEVAALAGFALALAGAFVHLAATQARNQRLIAASLAGLGEAYGRLEGALAGSRDEVRQLVGAFEEATRQLPGQACSELVSEMRLLHAVLEQLAPPSALAKPPATAPAAPSPAQAATSGDDAAMLALIREALHDNRVDIYLQPVVSLPQRKTAFYEAFSRLRGRDGSVIEPAQYLEVAERAGLMTAIDNNLLFRSIQLARKTHRQNLNYGLFCNISPYTLRDTSFFPEFIDFMAHNARLAASLIFEFSQADLAAHDADIARNLARLAAMGFRFGIDQVTSLDLDFEELRARDVSFVKIEAGVLLAKIGDPQAEIELLRMKRTLDRARIALIVEKIESEQQLVELLDLNVDFGQGYLFGEPRLSRVGA